MANLSNEQILMQIRIRTRSCDHSVLSKLVVVLPLLRVIQDIVRLCNKFELLLSLLLPVSGLKTRHIWIKQ